MSGTPPTHERSSGAAPAYSVVITVYNEEGNIDPVIDELYPAMERLGAPFEIVFCDDASTDATGTRLAAARARHANLRVVRHRRNRGKSVALLTACLAARGDWLVMLDGDGQNDPADIVRLVALANASAGDPDLALVAGTRRKRRDTWLKRISSRVANRVRSAVLGDRTPDTGCGLKLCRRDAYLKLPRFDHNHRFLPALIQRDGGTVLHIEVTDRPRLSGRSKYGLGNRLGVGIVDLAGVYWLMRRRADAAVEKEE
ncbi:MAG TPA: glycosyltransferase family 2 protein [Alphaproteobacteria bacterium]|nr:glycosyltransferase family 2 protein [Alphaproteobacteria bacterium]